VRSDADRLRRGAVAASERWAAGRARALEGIPLVVKDNIAVDDRRRAGGRGHPGATGERDRSPRRRRGDPLRQGEHDRVRAAQPRPQRLLRRRPRAARARPSRRRLELGQRERPDAFGEETASILRGFAGVTEADCRAALKARERLREALLAHLQGRSVLLLPALRVPAPPVGADEVVVEGTRIPLHVAFIEFMLAFSLAGVPAVVVPAGPLPGGLVASVQLVAAPGDEGPLLDAARRIEAAMGGAAGAV
jgi:Asp-tRNA(Asn)/Glu-tRNA(Gln) amidotransferase A subunit family amidase